MVVDEARQVHEGHLDALAGFVRGAAPLHAKAPVVVARAFFGPHEGQRGVGRGYSDSNPEFKRELEKCHSKQGGWPADADFDFVYTFSYGAGSDRLIGFSCRHEGVTPFIPADAYDNCNKHDDC